MDFSLLSRLRSFTDAVTRSEFSDREGVLCAVEEGLQTLHDRLERLIQSNGTLYIVGNGGSAGVASHAVTDFFNVAKMRASTLHESSLLTCMANDFGYENAYANMIDRMAQSEDIVMAISSSGNSMNIRNLAAAGRNKGAFIVTLSGFATGNPLRRLGDLNIWLDSHDYGFVEIGHQFILHNIADRFNKNLIKN